MKHLLLSVNSSIVDLHPARQKTEIIVSSQRKWINRNVKTVSLNKTLVHIPHDESKSGGLLWTA